MWKIWDFSKLNVSAKEESKERKIREQWNLRKSKRINFLHSKTRMKPEWNGCIWKWK
jgi:hypothetical protein